MKIKICWLEGRTERCTETDLPNLDTLEEMQEYIRKLLISAYKYNDEPIPRGLIKEGESIT